MIEITTFRLAPGSEESGFEAADRTVQTQFAYQQPGLARRTTARATDGGWAVVTVWRSVEEADAARTRWADDPAALRFMACIDESTLRRDRYATLD